MRMLRILPMRSRSSRPKAAMVRVQNMLRSFPGWPTISAAPADDLSRVSHMQTKEAEMRRDTPSMRAVSKEERHMSGL